MQNPFRLPLVALLLRAGLAFSFIYPAISAVFDPYAWVGYFPVFVTALLGDHSFTLLHVWGVFEIALALWVLFGVRIFIPCIIMAVALVAVILTNLAQFPILFRDVPIALIAIAVAITNKKKYGSA